MQVPRGRRPHTRSAVLSRDGVVTLDRLVAEGAVESRSDAVRTALRQLIERRRRAEIGRAIVAEYEGRPQGATEVGWADAATRAMIAEEPW